MPQLNYTYIDAHLPKRRISAPARLLRRYRGTLNVEKRVQSTYYWCGPAAAQMALLIHGIDVPQATLARKLGTTVNGTNHVGLFPPVLDDYLPEVLYSTALGPRREALWTYVNDSIEAGYGVIANIVASKGIDAPPFYPNGDTYHYVLLVGTRGEKTARGDTRQLTCADSANFGGVKEWSAPLDQWVSLISAKGIAMAPRQNLLGMTDAQLAEFAANMRQLGPT
ncbi:lysin A, protease C39 domain [Gordonia phage Lilbeanie]|uniref:Lysin A, protease C39 domain n=1 Tax=Gordonia phage Lilbeanie TaxID=2794947 RepID=A0A7T1NWH7_9CAUD|nr:endolysin [Gordonia phage Lilbeanie]QPO17115.1 lysin A, protease C39 domain [Gordonia phage Lilbeanie]